MESREEKNNYYIQKILSDVVKKKLVELFIKEWNTNYKKSHGVWDNTNVSGQKLFNIERTRKKPLDNHILSKFQVGDTSNWDCTTLFSAILYSKSIGTKVNPKVRSAVDALRIVRNKFIHEYHGRVSDTEFDKMLCDIEMSFKDLAFLSTEINEIKCQRNKFNSFQVLPCKSNHDVVKRTELLNQITADLNNLRNTNNNELTYYYISGNPGSGKSQLARQMCEEMYNSFDWEKNTTFVMTLEGKDVDSLLKTYAELYQRLSNDKTVIENIRKEAISSEDKIKDFQLLLKQQLKSWKTWWIVVDNVVELDKIYALLPQVGDHSWKNGQIVVTVQNTDAIPPDGSLNKHISVSHGMNNEECRQLLSVFSDVSNHDEKYLKNLSDKFDRQPLFLANAASYVGSVKSVNPTFTWEQYFDKLNEGEQQNIDGNFQKINTSHLGMKTVMLAVQKNAEESILLEHVFKLFSIISFDPLPQDVIIPFIKSIDPQKSAEDVCLQLKHCSLFLQTENNDIRLHSVVHEAIINYSSQTFGCKQNENNSKKSAADLAIQVAWALNHFKDREDEIKIIPHLIKFITNSSFQHFLNKLIDVKSFFFFIRKQKLDERNWKFSKYFVDVLERFYNYKYAIKVLYEITEIQAKVLGVDHIHVSYSYNELGELLWKNGEYENAKDFLERAMGIQAKTFGPDHVNIATTYNNLGLVYNDMGEYRKAKDFYERAIEIESKAFGPDHVNIAIKYNNLGLVYNNMGEYEKAKDFFERGKEIQAKAFGPDHVSIATTYNNLGLAYSDMGEYKKAKDFYERAIEIESKAFGPDHVNIAIKYNNLGTVYKHMGEYEKTKDFFELAMKILTKTFGPDHVNIVLTYSNLGLVYNHMGEYEKAKDFYQRAIEIETKTLGPDHINIAIMYKNLGSVYYNMGEYKKAKDFNERAIEIEKNTNRPDHVNIAITYNNLGTIYSEMGDKKKAIDFYERAIEIETKALGPDHDNNAETYNNLGSVYIDMGEYEKAKDFFERARDIKTKTFGPDHINTASTYNNLGLVYRQMGEYEKAKDFHERAIKIQTNSFGPDHVNIVATYKKLGSVYSDMGEYEKAKDFHERAMKIQTKAFGPDHVNIATMYNSLGVVYQHMGEYEKAKDFHERAIEIETKTFGPDHVTIAATYNNLGLVYRNMVEYEKAKDFHERAIEIEMKAFGPDHVNIAATYNNLGLVYKDMGENEKAKDFYERAIEIETKTFGPDHVNIAVRYNNLALVYSDMGEYEKQ
ncbi:uncharacterized protein LOC124458426 [Xenia sp. Carnegie-2017]|uniref:uncharacterized protein LOC124458426 n=1 Tax=Xenia sp. Carnegie-2017 TaxID=2897299 RepID=UPI001F03610C|nr:uncharacterized protein LOC124458426 [Xenia sp. Carnegie-2017]